MTERLDIDTVPLDEECAQVGSTDYSERSKIECRVFADQIIREHGKPPGSARIAIKRNPHDFGTYLSIELVFNDDNEDESEWAYNVEGNLPMEWDEIAKENLKKEGYYS